MISFLRPIASVAGRAAINISHPRFSACLPRALSVRVSHTLSAAAPHVLSATTAAIVSAGIMRSASSCIATVRSLVLTGMLLRYTWPAGPAPK